MTEEIVKFCDNCRKKNEEVDACLCTQRDFHKYPKTGFPKGDPRAKQLRGQEVIT